MRFRLFSLPILALLLTGCEQLDLFGTAAKEAAFAAREAEGKAIGGACRHAGRALEDCYLLSPKASKAAIFAGWRDFDAYMRENKIEIVRPMGDEPEPKEGEPPGGNEKAAEEKKTGAKEGTAAAVPDIRPVRRTV